MVLESLGPLFIGTLVAYFLVIIGIGYYAHTKTETEADFLVAGREIGPITGGATLSATQLSAGTFVGTVGLHYLLGVGFIWIWIGLWTGWIVSLLFVAPQMRRFGALTVPDFLASRYCDDGADGTYVRAIGALLIVAVYTVYLTAQYTAAGIVLQSMLGLELEIGAAIMMVVAIAYTAVGGMRASILTDFVQAVVMAAAALVAVPLSLYFIGGLGQIDAVFASFDPSFVGMSLTPIQIVGFMAAFGLALAAAPFEIARIYSMKDEKTVRQAIGITLIFQTVIGVSVALIGVTMGVMFPSLSTPDLASIVMSLNVLGPILGALLVAAIFSAILSTIDSVMIVSGAGIAHDFYASIVNPGASEERKLWANRAAIAGLGVIPLVLVTQREILGGLVQLIVALQAAMMGAMFFVPLIAGLHWDRATTEGGVAGMIVGFSTVTILQVLGGGGSPEVTVIPGAIFSVVALVVVSYLTSPPSERGLERVYRGSGAESADPPDG